MTVSIVIPTYERAELLRTRSIPSVLAQTHADWELHVVGDGTDFESEAVVLSYAGCFPRIRFTNLPHQAYPDDPVARWGVLAVDAINHGWDTAEGDWLVVLGDDDELEPDGLATMLAIAERHPDAAVVYGQSRGWRENGPTHQTWGAWPPGRGQLTEGGSMRRTALPYRYETSCLERHLEADADLWVRMYEAGVVFAFEPLAVHRYWQR